jgi:hypothetical protein
MNGPRQNIQYSLVLEPKGRGETPAGDSREPNHLWRSQHPKARL